MSEEETTASIISSNKESHLRFDVGEFEGAHKINVEKRNC